jgi:hypothetical protein
VPEEPGAVGHVLRGRLTLRRRRALGLLGGEAGRRHELRERRARAVAMERRDDVVGHRALLLDVRQQLHHRRLVGDQRAHALRVTGDEREPGDRTAAAAEDVRSRRAEVVEDGDDVVGAQVRRRVLLRVVEDTARDAARIRGDHGVLAREGVGERGEER